MKKIGTITKYNIFIIIIVLTIISVVSIGTYALLVYNSTRNTELTIRIGELSSCVGNKGPDLTASNLGPVFNYADGESTTFTVSNYTNASIPVTITLKVTSISSGLKRTDFKYAVSSSTNGTNYTKLSEGNFSSATNGRTITLLSAGALAVNTTATYRVTIFIDGNAQNPTTMMSGSLSGTLNVSATC